MGDSGIRPQPSLGWIPPLKGIPVLKFRTLVAVAALATVALLVPATAQAAPAQRQGHGSSEAQLAWGWKM